MAWPGALEFQEAVQTPEALGPKTGLGEATLDRNRHGLPVAYTGRFAAVFRFQAPDKTLWAARFFTTQDAFANRVERYVAISRTLTALPESLRALFVPFEYVEQGILVAGSWYPLVKMAWAPGTPLGAWVAENVHRPRALRHIATVLTHTCDDLQRAGIAHGDWQHDNILVSPDGRRVLLVDYDGIFVPALAGEPARELGHPNYQHPRRTPADFHAELDRFACVSIALSLQALALEPSLLEHCDNSLLLKKSDYEDLASSEMLETLERLAKHDPVLKEDLDTLWALCGVARRTTPKATAPIVKPPTSTLWYSQEKEVPPVPVPAPPVAPPAFTAPRTLAEYKAQLVTVPGGEFTRGSQEQSDEFMVLAGLRQGSLSYTVPPLTVLLREFQIGKTPVTVGMYQEFVAANPHYKSAWAQRAGQMPLAPAGGVWKGRWWGLEAHPMVNVSWDDADAFAAWAGLSLPTEAQWEKAARGTDGRRFPWGTAWSESRCQCSHKVLGDSDGTAAVGNFPTGASPYGALDMAGNVWEWCADWYLPDYYLSAPTTDPKGPPTGTERVIRGGSWRNHFSGDFRCANRERSQPTQKNILIGFRLLNP